MTVCKARPRAEPARAEVLPLADAFEVGACLWTNMLPVSDYLFTLLRERKQSAGASPWVFPGKGPAGHIVEPKKFSQRVTAASGVTFTLHDLRRTYITIAESLDIPHYALKRLLNHRSSADVTGGYIIINVDRLRGPVELISERILEMKEP